MKEYETLEFDFVNRYLVTDEYVLWKGKPEKGKLFSISDIYVIPISIIFFIVALLNLSREVIRANGSPFTYIFSTAYFLIALYVIFGRFIHIWLIRKYSYYVVTNKKIIRKIMGKIDTLDLKTLPSINTKLYKNGNGTIYLGKIGSYRKPGKSALLEDYGRFALENIADAVKVQNIISTASSTFQ